MIMRGSWVIGLKVMYAKNLQKTTFLTCIPRQGWLSPHPRTINDHSRQLFQLISAKFLQLVA